MVPKSMSTLEQIVSQAIRAGGEALEVEYKDGYEEVCVVKGMTGLGFRLKSSSREARSLREALYKIAKKKQRISVDGCEYELRCRVYNSFGEDAFRVELRPVRTSASKTRHPNRNL